jgi:hypothetical protein
MNAQLPKYDTEGYPVVSEKEDMLESERYNRWLVASGKACLIEEDRRDTSNEEEDTSNEEVQLVAVGVRMAEVSLPYGNIVSFSSTLLTLCFRCCNQARKRHQARKLFIGNFLGKLLERKDLEEMTEEINCHLYTYWNKLKHDLGRPCDSLQHMEDWRLSSVKALLFPWRVYDMSLGTRRVLYVRWKELELHALSNSFEEERELAASALEQEFYEQEMEERTKIMIEETN